MDNNTINDKCKTLDLLPELMHAINQFMIFLANYKRFSKNTCVAYNNDLYQFLKFLLTDFFQYKIGLNDLERLTLQHFRSYLGYLNNQQLERISISRKLSSIRSFFNFLSKNNFAVNNHIEAISLTKVSKKLPRPIEEKNIYTMMDIVLTSHKLEWINLRNYALLTMLYGCGMRISECLSITFKILGSTSKCPEYIIIKGKGDKDRIIPIVEDVAIAINKYLKKYPFIKSSGAYLFINQKGKLLSATQVQRLVAELRRKLNLEDATTPHAFRHSFATHLLQNGADIRYIQELLGHSSLQATQRYLKMDLKELKNSQSNFHPRSKSQTT